MLRIGLAGLGVHGMRYARHLLDGQIDGAGLTAVCRKDREAGRRFADEHGVACAADVAELCGRSDVDAVILVLPPDRHAQAAVTCLESGRPVLVEKPLAASIGDAERVAEACQRTGTPLMVGQTLRFDDVVRRVAREAPSIGPLRQISIHQRFEPSGRPWLDRPGPGGILLNTGVHGFDLVRHLTGLEPVSVICEAGRSVTRETDDEFIAAFRLEPGHVMAVVDNARTTESRSGRIELIGRDGQIWGDHIHRTLCRVRGRERIDLGPVPDSPTIPRTIRSFVRCVVEGKRPEIDVGDGLATLRMIDAAGRAALTGRRVEIESGRNDAER